MSNPFVSEDFDGYNDDCQKCEECNSCLETRIEHHECYGAIFPQEYLVCPECDE